MAALSILMMLLVAALAYAWVLYPLLLRLAAKRCRPTCGPSRDDGAAGVTPFRIAAIVAAHNEADHIEERLRNLADALESAKAGGEIDRYRILLGSDGSTDNTVRNAAGVPAGAGAIDVRDFGEQRGKIAVLKDLVAEALRDEPDGSASVKGTTILLFTDANTAFAPDALVKLLGHFADPSVGGVCGRLNLTSEPSPVGQAVVAAPASRAGETSPEGAYWRWENRLKKLESDLDSCLGANGAIYAVRGNLFWQDIPANTIVEDFVIGMKVREQGARMVYEPAAVAEEKLPAIAHEWRRRVRIGAGDFQALRLCRHSLRCGYGKFAWMFWSHKVLRWFTPHFLLGLLILAAIQVWVGAAAVTCCGRGLACCNMAALARFPLSLLILAGTAGGVACAAVGRVLRRQEAPRSAAGRVLAAAEHFATMQAALFVGFLKFCAGRLEGQWQRTPRSQARDVE